jgi:hypothetical protein
MSYRRLIGQLLSAACFFWLAVPAFAAAAAKRPNILLILAELATEFVSGAFHRF